LPCSEPALPQVPVNFNVSFDAKPANSNLAILLLLLAMQQRPCTQLTVNRATGPQQNDVSITTPDAGRENLEETQGRDKNAEAVLSRH